MQNKDMKLDKELCRQAREWYREWNVAESKARYQAAEKWTPEHGWQDFFALWQFSRQMNDSSYRFFNASQSACAGKPSHCSGGY